MENINKSEICTKVEAIIVEWDEGGNRWTAKFMADCSGKNVYAQGEYTKNGAKTTITAIKNSIARFTAE